jgi:hypothetical protein
MNEPNSTPPVAPDATTAPGAEIHQNQAASVDESAHSSDRALARDVTTLVATVDQHSAEIDMLNRELLIFAFAFGALAGLVFLQHRNLKELAGAVAG